MSPSSHTILARFPRVLLDRLEGLGADRDDLLRESGLREDQLRDPDARIPVSRHWNLWRVGIDRMGDPQLGIRLGATWEVRDAGLVGYAMLHSGTLEHAMDRLVRYERIMEDTTLLSRTHVDGRVNLEIREPAPLAGLRQPIECDLAAIIRCFREITATDEIPAAVHVPYPRPDDSRLYREILGDEILFDRPNAAIVFNAADLERPVVASDPSLCNYLDTHADGVLASLGTATFSERVRRVLWEEMSEGQPTLESVAGRLGVSSRTLQRRLAEEDATFANVLDGFREHMAVVLLQRQDLAIYEVAFLLGYSEPSTFFRAFRRWKRTSPRQFRQVTNGQAPVPDAQEADAQ